MSNTTDTDQMIGRCFRTTGDEFTCAAVLPQNESDSDDAVTMFDDDTASVMRLRQSSETPHGTVERELRVIARVSPDLRIDLPDEMKKLGEVFMRAGAGAGGVMEGYVCRELRGLPIAALSPEVLDSATHRATIASGFRAVIEALFAENMIPAFALNSPIDMTATGSDGYRAFIRFVDNILYDADSRRTTLITFNGISDGADASELSARERDILVDDMLDDFWAYLEALPEPN